MARKAPRVLQLVFAVWLVSLLLAGCGDGAPSPALPSTLPAETQAAAETLTVFTPTPTIPEPTPTPAPLVARVNGEALTLAEYEAELARFQAAQNAGAEPDGEGAGRVLEDLIANLLLAQAAAEAGFTLDEAGLQGRVDALAAGRGGAQALEEWIAAHGYTQADFRQALRRAAAAAWMRDKIVAAVPETAEHIHARQILLYNSEAAEEVLARLRAGTDFASLAVEYDPVAGGDLGWFPQGILTVPALDQAAFALQEGQFSEVVRTPLGYHLVQVIERQAGRPLDPSARLVLQERALREWLEQRRAESQIEIFLP